VNGFAVVDGGNILDRSLMVTASTKSDVAGKKTPVNRKPRNFDMDQICQMRKYDRNGVEGADERRQVATRVFNYPPSL
jgi:hypothetical protein